jgi:hypothetical protein
MLKSADWQAKLKIATLYQTDQEKVITTRFMGC